MTDTTIPARCGAQRADGRDCQARALPGQRFCWAHSPELRGKREGARAEGGRNKATPTRLAKRMPPTLRPLLDTLYSALDEVHQGTLDPRQASSMASLAGAIARLYETAELEGRLVALEGSLHNDAHIR